MRSSGSPFRGPGRTLPAARGTRSRPAGCPGTRAPPAARARRGRPPGTRTSSPGTHRPRLLRHRWATQFPPCRTSPRSTPRSPPGPIPGWTGASWPCRPRPSSSTGSRSPSSHGSRGRYRSRTPTAPVRCS